MTSTDAPTEIRISKAAWGIYSSRSFHYLRAWGPFGLAILTLIVTLFGVPVHEHVPVLLGVVGMYLMAGVVSEALPIAAALWRPEPQRTVLRVERELVQVSLERELTIPIAELENVRCHPAWLVLFLPRLMIVLDRKDGSAFTLWTAVSDRQLQRVLEVLGERVRAARESSSDEDAV